MAHERDAALQAPETGPQETDGRWPVHSAILLVAVISVGLWSLIIGVASWVTG